MKILFLSFYFPPDLSAGSFRSNSLVESLVSIGITFLEIEVITTLPNRYSSFLEDASKLEKCPGLTIHRIKTSRHNSGMLAQSKAFLDYAIGARKLIKHNDYDLVYATSGRLMTAVLGAYFAKSLRCPLYLDIRDIFADAISDALPYKAGLLLAPFFSILEKYAVNYAGRVNLVSAGFLPYFQQRYPRNDFDLFTNGIDYQFLNPASKSCHAEISGVLTVVYAGNIGEGQGLHKIIPELAQKYSGKLLFKIFGDGGRANELTSRLRLLGCHNVILYPPVNRSQLVNIYRSADILFLHLNNFDAFKKVLPSKLFEYAATGKPIWAGVAGYAEEFIKTKIDNSAVFPPCNVNAAMSTFNDLKIVTRQRTEFIKEFSRKNIMKKMAENIINFGQYS